MRRNIRFAQPASPCRDIPAVSLLVAAVADSSLIASRPLLRRDCRVARTIAILPTTPALVLESRRGVRLQLLPSCWISSVPFSSAHRLLSPPPDCYDIVAPPPAVVLPVRHRGRCATVAGAPPWPGRHRGRGAAGPAAMAVS